MTAQPDTVVMTDAAMMSAFAPKRGVLLLLVFLDWLFIVRGSTIAGKHVYWMNVL
jgi:hypothetical protein